MDTHSGSTSSWDYLDFELEIRVGGPREYPVAVRSPAGEAQGQMRFPYDEWELKDRLQSLEIALLRSGGTRRRIPSPEEHTVQDFGRGLFESLLVGDVRTRYEMSLSEARRQGKGLRLKLRIQPSELAVLPWEFLYDAERDRYPSLSSNTPLVRYLDLPQPVEPLRVSPPLRVLGMVTSPMGLNPLDVEHEKRLVEEATRGLREGGVLELTWLEGQTWRHLQRAMRRGPWHIFHFVGHGGFDPASEEGAIALSNEAGHMHLLRATSLAELLDDHYPLRLVFLNSCEGARGSENDAFSSTAATLVRRGVPAVVAMQYEITDTAAIEFSRDFYQALADSLPVDAAVTEARAAVSIDSMLEWGTPVLYMHSPDGHVFDISTPAPRVHPTPETEDRQEEDPLRWYREAVESAWADGKLPIDEVQWLRHLANDELGISPNAASDIEREVMGDPLETILGRQEEAARQGSQLRQSGAQGAQARTASVESSAMRDQQERRSRRSIPRWAVPGLVVALAILIVVGFIITNIARRQDEPSGQPQNKPSASKVEAKRAAGFTLTRTLTGHSAPVLCVAFSLDGKLLASGSEDTTVKIFDPQSGKLLRTLTKFSRAVGSVAFSPDGKLLASSSQDEPAKIFDPQSGKLLRTLGGDSSSVAFSPDGKLLAVGGEKAITLWDPQSGKLLRTLSGHSLSVEAVAFSPDGEFLASGSLDDTVKLWDPQSGKSLRTLSDHYNNVSSVAFSPDGKLLASGSWDETVKLWDPQSGKSLRTLSGGHSAYGVGVAFSPDGRLLASSHNDTVELWDPQSGERLQTLADDSELAVSDPIFSPDGKLLASGSLDDTVKLWGRGGS